MVDLSRYDQQLTQHLVNIIERNGFVETGRLRNSIDVVITSDFQVNINSVEYLKYLEVGGQPVLNEFYNSPLTTDILEQAYKEFLENKFKEEE